MSHKTVMFSLFLLIHDLLLEGVWLGEVNADFVGGQLVIDLSHGVELALNLLSVEGIKEDLHVFLSIKSHSGVLSSDSCREALLLNIN